MSRIDRRRFAALVAAGTAAAAVPRRTNAQAARPAIRFGGTLSDDMTPVVYARSAGIFTKYGLDVELTRMTSGAATAAALVAGALDIGKVGLPTILEAHERGIALPILAAPVVNDPKAVFAGFIVPSDSPIHTGKDFTGQLVGVQGLGDLGMMLLPLWIAQHGGDPKAVRFVEVPGPSAPAALTAGRIAVGEMSNPMMANAIAGGKFRLIRAYDAIPGNYLQTAIVTTKSYSTQHPEVVHAFAAAFGEAATYVNAHHDETAAMMADFTGIPLAVIRTMARSLAAPKIVPALIQPMIDLAAKSGVIPAPYPAAELIDPNVR
jgi:NitT/TauT family transport system substrate-binding protein